MGVLSSVVKRFQKKVGSRNFVALLPQSNLLVEFEFVQMYQFELIGPAPNARISRLDYSASCSSGAVVLSPEGVLTRLALQPLLRASRLRARHATVH